jgi:MYXO-CTERM domain-containing protein
MKTRALAVLAVAGLAAIANAQDTSISYSIVWDKASINPGETNTGKVIATVTPGFGATIKWTTPPGKGQNGILKAFASSIFDTVNLLNGEQGTLAWTVPTALNLANIQGNLNGGGIVGTNAGQVAPPINPNPNVDNPITILNLTWTGNAGFSGNVSYNVKATSGKMFLDISTTPTPTWVGHNATKLESAAAGNFTVVPAPASMALLGLGGLVAARRRR